MSGYPAGFAGAFIPDPATVSGNPAARPARPAFFTKLLLFMIKLGLFILLLIYFVATVLNRTLAGFALSRQEQHVGRNTSLLLIFYRPARDGM
jgi:hypothetical protein